MKINLQLQVMEFIGVKRGRKRKRKNRYINKQRRDRIKFEVKPEKHQKIVPQRTNLRKKEKLINNTMEASAFWENYKAAHEWQKKHNVTWWKTRCFALEHENHVLKETIRNLMQNPNCSLNIPMTSQTEQQCNKMNTESGDEDEDDDDDNLEFHLNQDMMDFLAQSIRHKIELKNKRDSEEAEMNEKSSKAIIESGLASVQKRNENAKLLYGEASSKVLAMETALQTTIERHIDKAKPQYWPNIPLKL